MNNNNNNIELKICDNTKLTTNQIAHLLTHQLENENSAYFNFIYDQIPASFTKEQVNYFSLIFYYL
jgi:hypothetical protein